MDNKIRVLVAKAGLDGHDRGAKVIAAALRDAGMEVIYTGLRQTPEMIVEAAIQEDVDVIGISILSGAHMTILPKIKNLMKEKGIDDILLTGGGIIPKEDIAEYYTALGKQRSKEGFALSEVIQALIITRRNIWLKVLSEGLLDTVLDHHQALELNNRVVLFFDRAIYFTSLGYEKTE